MSANKTLNSIHFNCDDKCDIRILLDVFLLHEEMYFLQHIFSRQLQVFFTTEVL